MSPAFIYRVGFILCFPVLVFIILIKQKLSGVRKDNIKMLADKTGAVEFHTSLRSYAKSKMDFIHPAFAASEASYRHPAVVKEEIEALLGALNN